MQALIGARRGSLKSRPISQGADGSECRDDRLRSVPERNRNAIGAYLASHIGIDFIVLTKGIPIRIDGIGDVGGIDRFSLDSRLAALGYDKLPQAIHVEFADPFYDKYWLEHFHKHFSAHAWANRFWNSHTRFSHARFGGYLVTRLDGYTEADAKALITRSLQAEQTIRQRGQPAGEILLNLAPQLGFTGKARQPFSILSRKSARERIATIISEKDHLGDFNSDMQLAADRLKARGLSVELEESSQFVGNRGALMGYISWGSNDPRFDPNSYHSLTFSPGALPERQVQQRPHLSTYSRRSVAIADLISQGVTGAKGYSDEPLIQAVASPSILFDRYAQG